VESSLALTMLRIKGIIVITEEDITLTNVADVAQRPTHPITPCADLHEQIAPTLSFVDSLGGACLICSSDLNGLAAAVCSAIIAGRDHEMSALDAFELVEKRRGPLQFSSSHLEAVQDFCKRPIPPPPPSLRISPTGLPLAVDLTTPKSSACPSDGVKRGADFSLDDPISPPCKKVRNDGEKDAEADEDRKQHVRLSCNDDDGQLKKPFAWAPWSAQPQGPDWNF